MVPKIGYYIITYFKLCVASMQPGRVARNPELKLMGTDMKQPARRVISSNASDDLLA